MSFTQTADPVLNVKCHEILDLQSVNFCYWSELEPVFLIFQLRKILLYLRRQIHSEWEDIMYSLADCSQIILKTQTKLRNFCHILLTTISQCFPGNKIIINPVSIQNVTPRITTMWWLWYFDRYTFAHLSSTSNMCENSHAIQISSKLC